MKNSDIGYAHTVYLTGHVMTKEQRRSAANRLASSGFGETHILQIIGIKPSDDSFIHTTKLNKSKLEPKTLDSIYLLSISWEDSGIVPVTLARNIIQWGTSLSALAHITGIDINTLREAVNGSDNDSDLV